MTPGNYDEWRSREPDDFTSYKVGEFASRLEAEAVADEYYADMHCEFEPRPGGLIILWVWE